ncbi:MAG: short-subunit dehydrogenase [Planctomycetota bacterium]|jgi:short-subunit dehydrogenase
MAADDVVFITGASTGLGLALAQLLIKKTEHRLVLTARKSSLPRFAEAGIDASERVMLLPLDVRGMKAREDAVAVVAERWGGVDVLINNAGIAYRSVVEHAHEEDRLEQLDINFRSPMELVRLVLPYMRHQRYGRIITVSSVGGMMAMPTMAIYSASKFAVEAATESLWYEVRPWKIRVSLIEPGFIHSGSFQNTRWTPKSNASITEEEDPYHEHYASMGPFIARMMGLSFATHERVAKKILRTMRRNDPPLRVQATIDAHAFTILRRVLPRWIYHRVLYNSLPRIRKWGPRRPGRKRKP